MKNKKTSQHQFGGFLIAVVIMALFFYKRESKPEGNYLFQPTSQQNANTQQVNGLKEVQNYAE